MHPTKTWFVDEFRSHAVSAKRTKYEQGKKERNANNALTWTKLFRKTSVWMGNARRDVPWHLVMCLVMLTSSATEMHAIHLVSLLCFNETRQELLVKNTWNSRSHESIRLLAAIEFVVSRVFRLSVMKFFILVGCTLTPSLCDGTFFGILFSFYCIESCAQCKWNINKSTSTIFTKTQFVFDLLSLHSCDFCPFCLYL